MYSEIAIKLEALYSVRDFLRVSLLFNSSNTKQEFEVPEHIVDKLAWENGFADATNRAFESVDAEIQSIVDEVDDFDDIDFNKLDKEELLGLLKIAIYQQWPDVEDGVNKEILRRLNEVGH